MAGDTNNFKIGQQVKLNTGGPEMSVENTEGNTCVCRWFINGQAKTGKFVDQCLVLVVKTPPLIHRARKEFAANKD